MEHALIVEELKHQTVLATKPSREDLDLKHPRDKENASPVRKDSVEMNFLVKETSETTVEEHEADERVIKKMLKLFLIFLHFGMLIYFSRAFPDSYGSR